MKSKMRCFTGHREITENIEKLVKVVENELVKLIEKGYCYFGAGGARGFDTIAAQTVLDLKEQYPYIKLILALPCISQANSWSYEDREIYEDIKKA